MNTPEEGIVVISLFDGMSCLQLALQRAGIKVKAYYAAEIDKHAIAVTQHNFPNTIQIGDVTKVKYENSILYTENGNFAVEKFHLLGGGSPCQGFSFAGKQLNFEDPRSRLFFEFARIKRETDVDNFILENVVMKQEYQDVISELMAVKPVFINSSLVSAQIRKRLYWTNFPINSQPVDKGIFIKDILEDNVDEKYIYTQEEIEFMCRGDFWNFQSLYNNDHNAEVIGNCIGKGIYSYQVNPSKKAGNKQPHTQDRIFHEVGKSVAITSSFGSRLNVLNVKEGTKCGFTQIGAGDCFDTTFPTSLTRRGRNMKNKSNCLTATKYLYNRYLGGDRVRRLTPVECERLQTVPDNYTSIASDSQRYKMLGNGWTVDVIIHILQNLNIAQLSQTNKAA